MTERTEPGNPNLPPSNEGITFLAITREREKPNLRVTLRERARSIEKSVDPESSFRKELEKKGGTTSKSLVL